MAFHDCNTTVSLNRTLMNSWNNTTVAVWNCTSNVTVLDSTAKHVLLLDFTDILIIFGVLTLTLCMAVVNCCIMSNFCRGDPKQSTLNRRNVRQRGREVMTMETGFSEIFEEVVSQQHYLGNKTFCSSLIELASDICVEQIIFMILFLWT